ncbi:MAG: transcriptional initiation protein Tat [Planctomycetes bacterium]|nr:transcriptional initiation protein Tat [Planctomycetota bacterium]
MTPIRARLAKPAACLVLLVAVGSPVQASAPARRDDTKVTAVETLPPKGKNDYYVGNREPLLPSTLIKLPIGSIRPDGWVRRQLEFKAEGFIGHLTEISEFCRFDGNAWTHPSGQGKYGWEEVPYWLRGFWNLGHILDDKRISTEAQRWVEAVLASQRPDGYFGSQSNLDGDRFPRGSNVPDLWPNMVMLYPLRSYYEATGDKRVLSFMLKYFRWQTTIPLNRFLPFSWQHWRAGDNLDSIYWLYNRTGESWLLDLARVNHERTAGWVGGIPTWHVVNIAECFRAPAQFYQQSKDIRYLRETERVYDTVFEIYGQVSGGLYGADENARPGFTGPRQAAETCAKAEMMYSDYLLVGISGDGKWADRAEDIAFNSLPASMTPDLKGLHYLTAPNQIQLDRQNKAPMIQNGGDMYSYNPHQYRCCQHNVAFAWPYYAEHLWMATPNNGLAPVLYAPSQVTARVGDGTKVTITETTDYPFDEIVTFSVSSPKPVRFPMTLRVPAWCKAPKLRVNGQQQALPVNARGWLVVERTWSNGDKLELELPMEIATTQWSRNRNTVSVHRGPLTYSLRIGERWERKEGTDKWPGFEVYPTTAWNYGLLVDLKSPAASFEVVRKPGPLAAQPFTVDAAPIVLRAKGKRIPEWKQESNGLVAEVQQSPVRSTAPVEEITLIPMGCARLRIASFPQIGEGPDARVWQDSLPIILYSNASHFEQPTAINDGVLPRNSDDPDTPRFTWDGRRGMLEWVEYQYGVPRRFSATEVYWAEDKSPRAPCHLPEFWEVQWWDGSRWHAVSRTSEYETRADGLSRVSFQPVETKRVRLRVQTQERFAAGIYEWRLQ